MADRTFDDTALYGSTLWTAHTLGLSKDSFFRRREALEAEGFPRRDRLTGLYLKADVIGWIERQRVIADRARVEPSKGGGARYDLA